jgi:CMP-N-acetylneuraminic acid synthetase
VGKTLAIIPARAGSKGIPNKNLRKIAGCSLTERAILAAQQSHLVDDIVLSTDGDELRQIGERLGVKVLQRPPHLAEDTTTTIDVLCDILKTLSNIGKQYSIVVLLEPTSPFRTGETIDRCVSKLNDQQTNTVVTVTQLERNPHNIFKVDGDQATYYVEEPQAAYFRRQDFTHLKRLNGCVYVMRTENVLRRKILALPIRVEEMTAEDSVNIDTILDLELADVLASK